MLCRSAAKSRSTTPCQASRNVGAETLALSLTATSIRPGATGRAIVLSWKPRRYATSTGSVISASSAVMSSSPSRAKLVAPPMTTRPSVRSGWSIAKRVATIEPME